MNRWQGYWVKDRTIIDINGGEHIDYLLSNPEKFNLSKDFIKRMQKKHIKDRAAGREELVKLVSEDGWIRVRQYSRPEYWSIQFDTWARRKKVVKNFVEWAMLDVHLMDKDEELHLVGFLDGYVKTYSYNDGGAREFLKENKMIRASTDFFVLVAK